jgi:hypothetical protein
MNTRTFWLALLFRMRLRRPSPCPPSLDLETCTLVALRRFVRHSFVLDRTWTSSIAYPVASATYKLPRGYYFWKVVNGLEVVVLFSPGMRTMLCLNLGSLGAAPSNILHVGEVGIDTPSSWMSTPSSDIYKIAVHSYPYPYARRSVLDHLAHV